VVGVVFEAVVDVGVNEHAVGAVVARHPQGGLAEVRAVDPDAPDGPLVGPDRVLAHGRELEAEVGFVKETAADVQRRLARVVATRVEVEGKWKSSGIDSSSASYAGSAPSGVRAMSKASGSTTSCAGRVWSLTQFRL